MSRSFRSNSSFSYAGTRTSRPTMNEQMQRDADQYTRKCQWESRNLETLKVVMKGLKTELDATKESIKKLKEDCEVGQMKVTFTKMRNLQKQIDMYNKRLNLTSNEADKIKQEIDAQRKQRLYSLSNVKQLEEEIGKMNIEIDKIYQNIDTEQNISNASKDEMLQLKLDNEENKSQYYKQLAELNERLRLAKQRGVKKDKKPQMEELITDTATVLKKRLTKIILNNKEKVRLIDAYQKNMKAIDQAFNTIKETTGLTDIEEIQSTFIKGEEQNYGLLTYVDVLGQEIDNLEDGNEQLVAKISSLRIENAQKQRVFNATPEEEKKRRRVKEVIQDKQKQINQFQTLLQEIQPKMLAILTELAKSKFNTSSPDLAQEYEKNGIVLNQSSLDDYLAELEDYTNKILVVKGQNNDQSVKEVMAKALMVDQLPAKNHKKKVNDNQIMNVDQDVNLKLMDLDSMRVAAMLEVQKYQQTAQTQKNRKK